MPQSIIVDVVFRQIVAVHFRKKRKLIGQHNVMHVQHQADLHSLRRLLELKFPVVCPSFRLFGDITLEQPALTREGWIISCIEVEFQCSQPFRDRDDWIGQWMRFGRDEAVSRAFDPPSRNLAEFPFPCESTCGLLDGVLRNPLKSNPCSAGRMQCDRSILGIPDMILSQVVFVLMWHYLLG
jgi:hypothetical protein